MTTLPARPSSLVGEFDAAVALLADARRVVVLAHVNPDADALGSALALALGLTGRGTRVDIGFGEPAQVPASLANLPGSDLIRPVDELPDDVDLVVTVDVNAVGRLGGLQHRWPGVPRLVIDHHVSNTRFGDVNLLDPAAESTSVLVLALLDELGVALDGRIAANVYAGLATDSVGFRYASPTAHRLAARLLEAGVDADELMTPITDTHPAGWLPMLAAVLARARTEPAGDAPATVWTTVTASDAQGLRSEETDSVVDILRSTAPVAIVFKQAGPQRWQVSMRSAAGIDVGGAAARLGGGGHRRAAGFVHEGEPADGVRAVRDLLAAAGRTGTGEPGTGPGVA